MKQVYPVFIAEYKKDCEVTKESVATVYLQDGEVEYDGYGVCGNR